MTVAVTQKSFNVLGYVAKDIQPVEDDSIWAVASVEINDTSGDLVKIDGIDTSMYHNPPQRYMKILAGHTFILDSGEPAIVGRIEEFKSILVNVSGVMKKALAFRMTFAKDGEGKLTPLAQKYKDLFDGNYLDSFSVGMFYYLDDAKENDAGGLTVSKSTLYEVSAVAVPANPEANKLKAISDSLGVDFKAALTALLNKDHAEGEKKSQEVEKCPCGEKHISETATKLEAISKSITELLTAMQSVPERLDVLESAIVVMTDVAKGHSHDSQKDDLDDPEQARTLLATLNRLNGFLDK